VEAVYARLGIAERFEYREHPGVHELNKAPDPVEFLSRHLKALGAPG